MTTNVTKKRLILGLGSNVGNRFYYIYQAKRLLGVKFDSEVISSKYYKSEAWGNTDQASFINSACCLDTDKSVEECLLLVKKIEQELGRKHITKWGPRCIDIDILFYGNDIVESELLVVPHPYISERSFVVQPLLDIIPEMIHPKLNKTILEVSKTLTNLDCVPI